jgi:hypothetical protein
MVRLTILALASAVVASCVVGAAASMGGLSAARLGSGSAAVRACDTDGVSTSYTTSAGKVVSVTVSALAATCIGGTLTLTLTGAGDVGIGTGGPSTVTGSALDLPLPAPPDAAAVTGVHVVIEGP